MRNVALTLVGFTTILLTVSIMCSLITLSVKDDELNNAVDYAANLTIDSLSNKYINGTGIEPNEAYTTTYHYDEAVASSIKELETTKAISDSAIQYLTDAGYVSVSQILNDTELDEKTYDGFSVTFANMVLENVFTNILMDCKDSNTSYSVKFYQVDAVSGILDVEVTQTSKYNAFKTCTTTARRTVFKETYEK